MEHFASTKYPPEGKGRAEQDTQSACDEDDDEGFTDSGVKGVQGRTRPVYPGKEALGRKDGIAKASL